MRLAFFFLLSFAVHGALFWPLLLPGGEAGSVIPVTLMGGGGNGDGGSAGRDRAGGGRKNFFSAALPRRAAASRARPQSSSQALAAGGNGKTENGDSPPAVEARDLFVDGLEVAALSAGSREAAGGFGQKEGWVGGAGSASGGNSRTVGGGSGGMGDGGGRGSGLARAGYAYNPEPRYPERAREEGWQGTVLLKVLVDREGKSKSVEVSRSSGFDTLDRAAVEAVKLWRFHPAHVGESRIESWVKIPIVFTLSEEDGGR